MLTRGALGSWGSALLRQLERAEPLRAGRGAGDTPGPGEKVMKSLSSETRLFFSPKRKKASDGSILNVRDK